MSDDKNKLAIIPRSVTEAMELSKVLASASTIGAIAPRITSLQQAGEIVDSGKRRKTRSGKSAVVWVSATKSGEQL